jgi:diadenosine tetraphosphate (Ap4A) HIT family hydrolase
VSDPECLLCQRIAESDRGEYPYFVRQLDTGYVTLVENQFHEGTTEFICKLSVSELHEMPADFRARYLADMALVAEAVFSAFKPRKLNYEALGNGVPHFHWRFFPRYPDDPQRGWPVWSNEEFRRSLEENGSIPSAEALADLKSRLQNELPAG